MSEAQLTMETFADEENQHVLTHWHNQIELIRIVEGTMQCVINGKTYPIGSGDVCVINQKQLHRIYCKGEDACSFQRIMVDPALFTADKGIYSRYIEPVLTDESFTHAISKAGNAFTSQIANLMDGIADLENLKPAAYELGVVALLHLIFQRLYEYCQSDRASAKPPVNTDSLLYRRMTDYIYHNYPKKLSLDDISSYGNVSRSKCCSVFKEFAQTSPIDFLNLYRLQVSTDMLKNSDSSIASIAFACGFGQQSYFNRLFLREYGMTPKEYRTTA